MPHHVTLHRVVSACPGFFLAFAIAILASSQVRAERAADFGTRARPGFAPVSYFSLGGVAVRTPGRLLVSAAAASDPEAIRLAEALLERMGGRAAWENTRYLVWRFFGRRHHHWDKWTGDVRIESDTRLVLMNLESRRGRAWEEGVEITETAALREVLDEAYAWWTNDSYWLVMPFKLLDPGVRLQYAGEYALPDGRAASKLTMTFENVGLTPDNRYDVWIANDSGLVEQWAFYPNASDPEPSFVRPWTGWQRFGGILLATDRGRGADWEIAVPDSLPGTLFRP